MLAAARRQGVISPAETRHLGYQLLVAGHETTTSLLGTMLFRLLERPQIMAALRADPGLIPDAVEEALRFDSPVHGLFRTRLVMNPDRMVIKEAQRTFTYLNLYGYLTDAVVVNRVFPADVEGSYFAAWREVQQEQMEFVEQAFDPVPVLRAPYFEQEVLGEEMLRRLCDSVFEGHDPHEVLYHDLSQELVMDGESAELRLRVPFVEKAEIDLKKIGLELVVRVGGHKRNIVLPSALASFRPREAKLEGGALRIRFARQEPHTDHNAVPAREAV